MQTQQVGNKIVQGAETSNEYGLPFPEGHTQIRKGKICQAQKKYMILSRQR